MGVRLKVGNYIIDSAPSSSTSTTTGVRLLPGAPDGPGVRYTDGRNQATVVAPVLVKADDTAGLKAAVDALKQAVQANANADLVYEYDAGSELASWRVSTGRWHRIEADFTPDWAERNCLVLVTFTATRVGIASDGAGDPDGAVTPVLWNFSLDANGRASCAGDTVFKSRADAVAWVQSLRAGSGRPAWMGSHFRFATAIWQKEQQQNQASPVPETAFTPAAVTVVFNAIPGAFAGNSAFDNVVSVDYDVLGEPRGPIDEEAGTAPGYNIVVTGTVQLKTDTDSTYDSSDTTKVDESSIRALMKPILEAIEQNAKSMRGLEWFRLSAPTLVPGSNGIVGFTIVAMSGEPGRVISWSETVVITLTPRDRAIPGSRGTRVHKHRLGPEVRVRHVLAVEAFSPQAYRPLPFISGNPSWMREPGEVPKPVVADAGEGAAKRHLHAWDNTWLYLGDASSARDAYEYADVLGGLS